MQRYAVTLLCMNITHYGTFISIMAKENENIGVFLQLLREELWQLESPSVPLPQDTVQAVLEYAGGQCLQGLVINSLFRRKAALGKDNVLRLFSLVRNIEANNSRLDAAVGHLAGILNSHSVRYIVFKGQTAARYYPNPRLRMPGDIDFYCYGEDYASAMSLIEREMSVEFAPRDIIDRHDTFDYKGVRFEMHYKMEILGSPRHQAYYDRIMDEAVKAPSYMEIGDTLVATLNATDNVLHVFKHLFNHLLVEGIGLRQFCDLALIISNTASDIDPDALDAKLRGIGYRKAFLAVGALLVKHLGLPAGKFPFLLTDSDYVWGDKIFRTVIACGNFGRSTRAKTTNKIRRSLDTAKSAFIHCLCFFPLAPTDIVFLVPRRIMISLRHYL